MLRVDGYFRDRDSRGRSVIRLKCTCDCGRTASPAKEKVTGGQTKSCGCLLEKSRQTLGEKRRLPDGVASFNETYGAYKKSATERGYTFELTKNEFKEIATKPCIYCGDVLTNIKRPSDAGKRTRNGYWRYTGIDRYDNSIGYTLSNSVPCCRVCNRVKTDMDVDTLKIHLQKMVDNIAIWERTA